MGKVQIKVCGIQTMEEIKILNTFAGEIDYAGFVFAESKRKVSKEQARELILALDKRIQTVGVFVNAAEEEIGGIVSYTGIDIVQMHGQETVEGCEAVKTSTGKQVWKAISIQSKEDILKAALYKGVQAILLDGAKAGAGKTFPWEWVKEDSFSKKYFTILAGGLQAENVHQGITRIQPAVVDVSSGVETEGRKSEEKIQKFIRAVDQADFEQF